MSKRRFDETNFNDESDESNKRPEHSLISSDNLSTEDQPNKESVETFDRQSDQRPVFPPLAGIDGKHCSDNQSISQTIPLIPSIDHSTNQTSNQANSIAANNLADHSNDNISQSVSQEEEQQEEENEEESSEEEPSVESEYEYDSDDEFELGIEQLSDYTIHFVDLINCRVSLHCHRFVLISMSKYFETLILDADDKRPSKCTITDKCKQPGHRCLNWPNEWIGGVEMPATDVANFFRSMYSAFDGSGESLKAYYQYRTRWNAVSDDCFLYYVTSSNKQQGEITYECWDYHGRFVITTSYFDTRQEFPDVGDFEPCSFEPPGDYFYHLANYFQCETLLKVYEDNAIDVVNQLTEWGGEGCDLVWIFLKWADKYNWSRLRTRCLAAIATDTECRSRRDWNRIASDLKPATLVEAFASAVEAQGRKTRH